MGMEGDFLQLLKERGYELSAPSFGGDGQGLGGIEIRKVRPSWR